MTDLRKCVLVVDDDLVVADLWHMILQNMGMEVCGIAATAATAVIMAQTHRPKVVLMDMRLRGKFDGVDAARSIHQSVGSKVIFITGSKDPTTMARIQTDHPAAVLFKPVSQRLFQAAVQDAMLA